MFILAARLAKPSCMLELEPDYNMGAVNIGWNKQIVFYIPSVDVSVYIVLAESSIYSYRDPARHCMCTSSIMCNLVLVAYGRVSY